MSELPRPMTFTPRNPEFEAVVRESFAKQNFLQIIGAELVEVLPGRSVIAVRRSDAIVQQQGLLHGAAIGAIGDVAGGYAALSLMPPDSEVVTVEYKINFVAPAKADRLVAIADVLRAGRTLSVCQIEVRAAAADGADLRSGPLIAILQATFSRVHLSTD
ncbi:MAG: PaaI family thioesterase [Pseudomonadota bacterium]